MPRSQLNLVLAAVLVALAVAVFFSRETDKPGPPLTALAPDEVTRIAIEHPGKDVIRLEKAGSDWNLVAPVEARAEIIEVSSLLGLADKEVKDTLQAPFDAAELELEPPAYTITLNDTLLAFGRVEPLQYRRYVRAGDAVHLIEDPPSAALDADYADLVAKRLLPEGASVKRIEVPGLAVSKDAEGGWDVQPADPAATTDTERKFVESWKNARAMWNELARDARVKGDPVTVTLDDDRAIRFVIAARDPQFKLHRADLGVTFVLSKALADELLKLPEPEPEPEPADGDRDGETPGS